MSHHKWDSQITRSKISYGLIEPQPLHCAPACSYKFHALAVHPSPKFTEPLVGSALGIRLEVCVGAFLQKQSTVGCFRRGAPSFMFSRFLNWLSLKGLPRLVLHEEILNFLCLLILLIHAKHKSNKMNSCTDPMFSFPLRTTHLPLRTTNPFQSYFQKEKIFSFGTFENERSSRSER